MRRLYILLAAVVIATTLVALTMSSAGAQQGGAQRYAAVAVAPSVVWEAGTGLAPGYGTTKSQATRNALNYCLRYAPDYQNYAGDCQGAGWVYNGWIAVAWEKSLEPPYVKVQGGWGWGRSEQIAVNHALSFCRDNAREPCVLDGVKKTLAPFDPSLPTRGGAW